MTDFAKTKTLFSLPPNLVYLDGNSLGPLPRGAMARAQATIEREWGGELIRAWNGAGWMDMPRRLGDRIARLIGAPKASVAVGDTLSIKVFQAVSAALDLNPERRILLSDDGNFPTDLYMADGLAKLRGGGRSLRLAAPDAIEAALGPDVAVLLLTQVDYRTGGMHDMAAITRAAHAHGIPVVWDLAHSVGALELAVEKVGADFAVGCTYKHLNGGPGAPAFIYVRADHVAGLKPALAGWLGHEAPFAFDRDYRPAPSVERMRVGTPPVIQMAILDAALDVFDEVDLASLRKRAGELSEFFIAEVERLCPQAHLVSPRDPARRAGHVSFRFDHGYAAMQALIANGVIGDFRAPDVMRFGITPLYVDEADLAKAAAVLAHVFTARLWDRPEFRRRASVT